MSIRRLLRLVTDRSLRGARPHRAVLRRLSLQAVVFVLLGAQLAACLPPPRSPAIRPWVYTDLRLIDPVDSTEPGLDAIALYSRAAGDRLQVRLDGLDFDALPAYDLYLALDTRPGGGGALPIQSAAVLDWDVLIAAPAHGGLSVTDAAGQPLSGTALRLTRDPVSDVVEISFRRAPLRALSFAIRLQVFLTPAGSPAVADELAPIHLDGPPPPAAPVLFAFWNTFPAYTPAMALRRWDGAHTGPFGGRHGLYNLLRVARSFNVPLVLLDLAAPEALSALEFAGGLPLVQELEHRGLLALPQPLPDLSIAGLPPSALPSGWTGAPAIQDRLQAASHFGLSPTPILYAPSARSLSSASSNASRVVFTWLPEASAPSLQPVSIWRSGGQLIVPLPGPQAAASPPQVDEAGLTLGARRLLVETALSAQQAAPPHLLPFGGDLTASGWGAPQPARLAFGWLAAHPWVRLLSARDLIAYPAAGSSPIPPSTAALALAEQEDQSALFAALQRLPQNPASIAAWQSLFALASPLPAAPPELPELRRQYLGQVGGLAAAAEWSAHPQPLADCQTDPDLDGEPECILASAAPDVAVFALFETGTGALVYAFAFQEGEFHQLVGPSSQLITGLSDPSGWDLTAGLLADPSVIPGAFAGPLDSPGAEPYLPSLEPISADEPDLQLVFTAPDGSHRKTYRLLPSGLRFEYQPIFASTPPARFQVPLLLDPWQRFTPGWGSRYQESAASDGGALVWELVPSPGDALSASLGSSPSPARVEVHVSDTASVQGSSFIASQPLMGRQEDPNREAPPGYFLPFPLKLVEIIASGSFTVELQYK